MGVAGFTLTATCVLGHISDFAEQAITVAKQVGMPIVGVFNDTKFTVQPTSTVLQVIDAYHDQRQSWPERIKAATNARALASLLGLIRSQYDEGKMPIGEYMGLEDTCRCRALDFGWDTTMDGLVNTTTHERIDA